MKTLLQIQSSLFGAGGQSSSLLNAFGERWLALHPGARIVRRDLTREPVPHLDLARFQSFIAKPEERSAEQRRVDACSMTLIRELREADEVALGVPMYNFSIPSVLHAYFDHVARAGITFRYTENGPEGLLKGKKAWVFITRGGIYGEEHFQTGYLRQFLGFIGIDDVEFVHAEGLALEPNRDESIARARARIGSLVAA